MTLAKAAEQWVIVYQIHNDVYLIIIRQTNLR